MLVRCINRVSIRKYSTKTDFFTAKSRGEQVSQLEWNLRTGGYDMFARAYIVEYSAIYYLQDVL